MEHLKLFFRLVWNDWVTFMSGLGSIILAAAAAIWVPLFPESQFPSWTFWVAAVICCVICPYWVWRKEHLQHIELQEQLKPKLEIVGATESSEMHYRMRVRNLANKKIKFYAELVSMKPDVKFPLPVRLQITNQKPYEDGEIAHYGEQMVTVFIYPEKHWQLTICANYHPVQPELCFGVPKQRYDLCIRVVPDQGSSVSRTFYIIPQSDGTCIFSAG
jgi:hypothetical protein